MISVLLVEDQAMLRESLALAIDRQEDMRVVGQIADAAEAEAAVEESGANLILMDVCTENDSSGIVAARRIKEAMPDIKVVVMTGMPDVTFVDQARRANVDSFVYKNVGTSELMTVMRSTALGYSTFPRKSKGIVPGAVELTDVEMDILRLVCKAKTRREIAAELYLSEGTVKRHISEILVKTGYNNILRLAVHAVSNGSIVPSIQRDE